MFPNLFSSLFRERSIDSPLQDNETPLSQSSLARAPLQHLTSKDGDKQRVHSYWHFLCYFLHAFLVALHLTLLMFAVSHHAERRCYLNSDAILSIWPGRLGIALQAFYTLYTALLVFVAQKSTLSVIYSSPKKLTQIHDICGAWAGFGAALSALWQQTKVASSVLPITLVTMYFACISVLHATSSALMQFQFTVNPISSPLLVLSTWPSTSVNLMSLDWMAVASLVPFTQLLSDDSRGIVNNTLYDVPQGSEIALVHATAVNAHCGLLTNLSMDALENGTWIVNASMVDSDPVIITVSYPPLLNEIWFSPSIQCFPESICSKLILFLVSAEMEGADLVSGVNRLYINGSYYSAGGTGIQNYSSPISFVACSLDTTNQSLTIGPYQTPLDFSARRNDEPWSIFSPIGDLNFTSIISDAIKIANSLPSSPYCQPIMSYPELWTNITVFHAYMRLALEMGVSPCSGASLTQYTNSPFTMTRGLVESAVSQSAAEFIWTAAQLGAAGGGFDPVITEYVTMGSIQQFSLNINILPVIFALCASIILLVLTLCVLWRHPPAAVPGAGVLEIMWFGSRSEVLRDHLSAVETPSLDHLRAIATFETIFWTRTSTVCGPEGRLDLYAAAPAAHDVPSSRSPGLPWSELADQHSDDLSACRTYTPNSPRGTRSWCYTLHIVFVALHAPLLACLVHHPEHSVVIPYGSYTLRIGLSPLFQVVYALYTAVLVFLVQRLASHRLIGERRKLTTVHDLSGAWAGFCGAIHILWQQRKRSSSTWEITSVVIYLAMTLALHILSSSIMLWELREMPPTTTSFPTTSVMPNSAVNISQLGWSEIFPVALSFLNSDVSPQGMPNGTIYDTFPDNFIWDEISINATKFTAQCGLVSNLTLSYQASEGEYQISFQNDTNNSSFLEPPIWKDLVHGITSRPECMACPQTLFYMITTDVEVDKSIDNSTVVKLNWTYTSTEGGVPRTSTTSTYIAACSLNAQTVVVALTSAAYPQIFSPIDEFWSVWTPANATDLSVGMATALSKGTTSSFPMFFQGNSSTNFTSMDSYIMSSLGLNLSYANETSASQSSANPSVTLSPWQLENAIAQMAAALVWTAGGVGESWGGFQRSAAKRSQGTYLTAAWQLHANEMPIILASIVSLLLLIQAMIIIGKGPSREHPSSVSGTSVLECLWLEARSELLHSRLEMVEEPCLDALREAGMFDVCLGDIGGQPVLSRSESE